MSHKRFYILNIQRIRRTTLNTQRIRRTTQFHGTEYATSFSSLYHHQDQLSKASPQIWFERGEAKDRRLVVQVFSSTIQWGCDIYSEGKLLIQSIFFTIVQRLKEHVDNPDRLPILIFPEGN